MNLLPNRLCPRFLWPRILWLVSGVSLLAGCAVGPDFHRPRIAPVPGYGAPGYVAHDSEPLGKRQIAIGRDIPGAWWRLFRSPVLTRLVIVALADNPSIAAAQATLRQARELSLEQRGVLFPSVSGAVARTREQLPLSYEGFASPPLLFSEYGAQLNLSYSFDIWGGLRRAVEQASARAEFEGFELEATDLALTAEVATNTIQAASLADQIRVQRELIGFEQRQLYTVRQQFQLGGATGTDVATQEAQVAAARTVLVPLLTALAQSRDALAADLGRAPSEVVIPPLSLDDLRLPATLPLSLPAALLDQRPDIRAAEAVLHQQTALLGVDIAARLPQVTLTASVGSDAADIHQLFSPGNGMWSLINQAVQPVFDAGQLLHAQRAQRAAMDNAAALWRNTVVRAFQNVADVLVALRNDEAALAASRDEAHAARRSLSLASLQYKLGGVSYLTVLIAQQSTQNAILSLLRARAARYTDTVALYQALGGGWWHRADLPSPPPGLLSSPLP
ncbi:efflux transporter outer membrane subunit [Lichenicoccus sp.]|uniref:efflux transporter outer membrane subunit n=1 Tax=Lichenicoccus sp. TaxID=2781899 RepID=UPI003D13FB2C